MTDPVEPAIYEIGDQPIIWADFEDRTVTPAVAVTPSGVRFVVQRDRDGAPILTYTEADTRVTSPFTGRWQCVMDTAAEAGDFDVHVYGTGLWIAAKMSRYTVRRDNIRTP